MQTRLLDLFIGSCVGFYLMPTVTVFGFTVPWALVGLGISLLFPLIKKLGRFLWGKFIQAVKIELNKD